VKAKGFVCFLVLVIITIVMAVGIAEATTRMKITMWDTKRDHSRIIPSCLRILVLFTQNSSSDTGGRKESLNPDPQRRITKKINVKSDAVETIIG
jgi:hypothetical protein